MRIGGEIYSTPQAQGNGISAHYSTDSTKNHLVLATEKRTSKQTHLAFRKTITSGIRANATLTHLESLTPCFYTP